MRKIILLLAYIICFNSVFGQTNIDVEKKKYKYIGKYGSKGLALVYGGGKYGFIDKKGKEVIPLEYDDIYEKEFYFGVTDSSVEQGRGLDESGWDDNILYLSVCKNKKWGLIDASNNIIVPCIYDGIDHFIQRQYLTRGINNGKYGAINIFGDIVIPFEYEDMQRSFPIWDREIPIYVQKQGKYGYIDENNNILIPFIYSTAGFFGKYELAPVSRNERYGFINRMGEEVIPLQYEFSDDFSSGLAAVVRNGKAGFIDINGQVTVPFRYTPDYVFPHLTINDLAVNAKKHKSLFSFKENENVTFVKKQNRWGIIDKKGNELTPFKYDGRGFISSDRIVLWSNGKAVFLDRWGNEYEIKEKLHIGRTVTIIAKAEDGDAMAQYELGELFLYDKGFTKDPEKAFDSYYKSAIQGYEKAYYQVAYMYSNGIGVHKNQNEAFKWLKKSAESGNMYGQYYLGVSYQYGTGTPIDLDKATYWYRKSMRQGHEDATKQLAELEIERRSTKPKPDPAKSIASLKWITYEPKTKQKDYSFRIGIQSDSKIEEVNVYLNETLIRGIIPVVNDGFDMNINRTVALNEGQNTIKVTVRNAGGVAVTEKNVFYNAIKRNFVAQQKKIALVMGNANYYDFDKKLRNPVNDATDVAAKLKSLGFTVICSLDQTQQGMEAVINNFGNQAMNYDVSLFYYAGHGVRSNGNNYLIPIDANPPEESYVPYKCTNANLVLDLMERAQCRMKIVILDACRNNPFSRSWNRSTSGGGLDIMNAPKGTFIAFSTAPGDVAQDGKIGERNSPYTAALLQTLDVPNLSITDFFQEVLERVATKTNDRQTPWTSNSFRGKFMFNQK